MPELAATFKWVSRGSHAFGNDLSSMTRASKRFAIAVGVPRQILMVLLLLVVAKVARRVVEVTNELFVRVREAVRVVEERGRGILGRRAMQGWSKAVVAARLKSRASSTFEGEMSLADALLLFQLKLLIMASSSLRVRATRGSGATGNSATTLAGALMVGGTGGLGCLRVRGCLVVEVTPTVGVRGYSSSWWDRRWDLRCSRSGTSTKDTDTSKLRRHLDLVAIHHLFVRRRCTRYR
jgi:hypothetical protein